MEAAVSPVDWETIDCPICQCAEYRTVLTGRDLMWDVPGNCSLVRCGNCQHVFLNPRPTRDTIVHCYPSTYSCHQVRDELASAAETGEPELRKGLLRRIPGLRMLYYLWVGESTQPGEYIPEVDQPSPRAVEIGCANGAFLERLEQDGWKSVGVELCDAPAQRARDSGLDVRTGDLESAAFESEEFDVAFAWGVIMHLHDPVSTLQEIHRVVRADGWFVFMIPNFACWERRFFRKYWYALQMPTQMHQFTAKSVTSLLQRSGFRVDTILYQQDVNNLICSTGIWLRTHLRWLGIGQRLIAPSSRLAWVLRFALAPLARFLARIRQSGRLTVIARRQSDAV